MVNDVRTLYYDLPNLKIEDCLFFFFKKKIVCFLVNLLSKNLNNFVMKLRVIIFFYFFFCVIKGNDLSPIKFWRYLKRIQL